jgi:ubiquinone/menaquinone biosynthesis C-methylase UbiE
VEAVPLRAVSCCGPPILATFVPATDPGSNTLAKNRQVFGAQSTGFSSEGDTYADVEGLKWMLQALPVSSGAVCLDVATGTGEFARALAPHFEAVVGLDATDAMIAQGKKFVLQAGIENIRFTNGVVEELPFDDESFDCVASRYAFHHFADPEPVISEMLRVCKTGGHVIVVDIVVPEESAAADYNYYERLCDPSHTRCLAVDEFEAYFRLFGADLVSSRTRGIVEELIEWMDFSLTEERHREEILRAVRSELHGGPKTGLAPFERDATLCFRQRDLAIVGRRRPTESPSSQEVASFR